MYVDIKYMLRWGVSTWVYVEARSQCLRSPSGIAFLFLRSSLSQPSLAGLAGQWSPRHLPASTELGIQAHVAIPLYGCWGFELRASCLCGKHFTV